MSSGEIRSLTEEPIAFEDTGKLDPVCKLIVNPNKSDTSTTVTFAEALPLAGSLAMEMVLDAN